MDKFLAFFRRFLRTLRPFAKGLYAALAVFLIPLLQRGTAVGTFRRLSIKFSWASVSLSYVLLFLLSLLYAYLIWQELDRNDEKRIQGYLDSPRPKHLLRLREPLWEYLIATILMAFALGVHIAPMLPEAVPAPLAYLFGGLVFLLLRPLQMMLSRWYYEEQDRIGEDRQPVPVKIGILNCVALLAPLLALPYLALVILALLFELFFLTGLGAIYLFIFAFAIAAGIFLGRRLRRVSHRKKFLKRLAAMADAGLCTYTLYGHPFLSLFLSRFSFEITLVDKKKRSYSIAVLSCSKRRRPLRLKEDSCFFIHGIPIKGTTGRWAAYTECSYLFEFQSVYELRFPTEHEGRKILLVDPPPSDVRVVEGKQSRPVDNGDRLWDYTIYSKNAFLNFLDRDLTEH